MEFKQSEDVARLVGDRKLAPPLNKRNVWSRSRMVITDEGPISLLYLIAREKFTRWLDTQVPIWTDRDYTNESFDNVSLVTEPSRRPRKSSEYGVKAGTLEYHRIYREKNKEKIRTYYREKYARDKAEMEALRLAAGQVRLPPGRVVGQPEAPLNVMEDQLARMKKLLET
jgi:hypothetical protein